MKHVQHLTMSGKHNSSTVQYSTGQYRTVCVEALSQQLDVQQGLFGSALLQSAGVCLHFQSFSWTAANKN